MTLPFAVLVYVQFKAQNKRCQEKTLDTRKNMLYDTQGDDEWKDL